MNENKKAVYHVADKPEGKPIWTKIGSAYINKDGSINVLLDSLPLDGRLHIRDENKKEKNSTTKGGDKLWATE